MQVEHVAAAPDSSRVAAAVDVGCAGLVLPGSSFTPPDSTCSAHLVPRASGPRRSRTTCRARGGPGRARRRPRAAQVLGALAVGGVDDVDEQLADDDDRPAARAHGCVLRVRRTGGAVGVVGVISSLSAMTTGRLPNLIAGAIARTGCPSATIWGSRRRHPQEPLSMGSAKNLVLSLARGRRHGARAHHDRAAGELGERATGRRARHRRRREGPHRLADRRGRRPARGLEHDVRAVRAHHRRVLDLARRLPDAVGHLRRRRADEGPQTLWVEAQTNRAPKTGTSTPAGAPGRSTSATPRCRTAWSPSRRRPAS